MASGRPLFGRRVLVVEDQYFIADELSRILAGAGAEVLGPTPNAEDALAILDEAEPDLALIDVNLGNGDAYPVAQELARQKVPFAFVTGYLRWAIRPEFRSVPYVDKPFTAATILAAASQLANGNTAGQSAES